ILKCAVVNGDAVHWDEYIDHILFAYRSLPIANLGYSPFEMLYGRQMRGPLEKLYSRVVEKKEEELEVLPYVERLAARMRSIAEEVRKIDLAQKKKEKQYYDLKASESFPIGSEVLLLNPIKFGKFNLH